ncbi:MAG: energy transducer TonB [Terracidiphilus sp.]
MRSQLVLAFCLVAGFQSLAQTAAAPPQGLPKDPRAILTAAASNYDFSDFSDPALEPFHLKATYQLYDENGNPAEQGTFEFWSAPPHEYGSFEYRTPKYRLTWLRHSARYSGWFLENGEYAYESKGEPLSLFEYKLQALLLAPLPRPIHFKEGQFRVVEQETNKDSAGERCFEVVPKAHQTATPERPQEGSFPAYCFDEKGTTLLSFYSPYERVLTRYGDVAQMQGRCLPRQLSVFDGRHVRLTAKVDAVSTIEASNRAFLPDAAAVRTNVGKSVADYPQQFNLSPEFAATRLVKRVTPIYPAEARKERIQGVVVLAETIGADGKVYYLRVVSTPAASLADSAFRAVSQWEYKPYEAYGRKEPVDTTVEVTFKLDQ